MLEAGSWKTVTKGRYGFIALTPWLHTHWERLQQIKDNEELCRALLDQSRSGNVVFRLSEMMADTARSSLQPELWGAALVQTTIPTRYRTRVITDNMASLQAFTAAGHRPNRNECRVTHKLHMAMEDSFHKLVPQSQNRRADAVHQYSHTEEHTLAAFLNRSIDTLLNHAPTELNTPQPNLANLEHQEGYLLFHKGQHIIGDRRRTLQREMVSRLSQACANPESSQSQVWKIDPIQCREIRNLAWNLGKTLHFLPTLLTAMWTENLLDYHTFSGAEILPCVHCHSPEGATAAHFLSGGDTEDLRTEQLFPALIKAVRDRSSRDDISDQEILAQLTFVPEAPPLPATMLDTDPNAIVGSTPTGKPVVVCPICRKQYSFSDRLGRMFRHTCIPPDEEEETRQQQQQSSGPALEELAAAATRAKPARTNPSKKRRPQKPRLREPVKQTCPNCDGSYTVNKDGRLRKHDCDRRPKQSQKSSNKRPKKKSRPTHPASPPPPQLPEPQQGPRPVPAFRKWKHRRTQNAFTIATFTGILTTAAILFLQFCIPNPRARATTIKNIRIAWLEYAYTAWRRHRKIMRSKDASRKYIRKRKGRSRPIGKDPPPSQTSKAQRFDDPIPSVHHQSGEDEAEQDADQQLDHQDHRREDSEPEWTADDEDSQDEDEGQDQPQDQAQRPDDDSDSDWHAEDMDDEHFQDDDDDQDQAQDQDQDQGSRHQASDQDQDLS